MVNVTKAKLDPASVFKHPHDVLSDTSLSHDEKIDILRRWAYDEREIEVAEEENMKSSIEGKTKLDEILKCLLELGDGSDDERAPTKQG
jgi:hypothetical protein